MMNFFERLYLLKLLIISSFLSGWCCLTLAQTVGTLSDLDSLLGCMSRVVSATRHVVQEKVYLHFDNTGYFMGEKMWFTAYVVRADGHRPGVRSRVLYVELLNPGGDVVQRRKLKIDERGHAHGDLSLDSLYGTGFYEVRAFTRYMANWGGAACFSRVFPVFRAPSSPGVYEPVIDERSYRRRLPDFREPDTLHRSRLNVSFYPEGGRLVSGLRSRVAFQVSDGGGRHVSADGELLDGEGRVVVRGFSDSTGRGVFTVPASCDGLRFRLRDARGRFKEFPLPESSSEGCVLELPPSLDDSLRFSVRGTASYRDRLLGYMLMNYGRVWSCDTFRVGSGYHKSYLRDSLPEGVNQLTVFDGRGRILCERLFFLFPKSSASDTIRVTSETARLTPCGKVRLRLHAIPGSVFSFSAMDGGTVFNGRGPSVKSWMLLSSEVKGYIEDVGYYFESDDSVHRRASDLLMLVQGWRRYDWEELSGYRTRHAGEWHPVEDTLYVTGRLRSVKTSLPVDGIPLKAYVYSGGIHLDGTTVTDSAGCYAFSLPDVWGEWNLQLKAGVNKLKSRYLVTVDRRFGPPSRRLSPYECRSLPFLPSYLPLLPDTLEFDTLPLLSLSERLHKLPEVDVKAKRRFTEGARAAWATEKRGQYWADVYYDCDEETERYLDEGKEIPFFKDWFMERVEFADLNNLPFFLGIDVKGALTPVELAVAKDTLVKERGSLSDEEEEAEAVANGGECKDEDYLGRYKGHPIVWILDNVYAGGGGKLAMKVPAGAKTKKNDVSFPVFLDEAKSVYITEDPSASTSYHYPPFAEEVATVFVYSHGASTRRIEKGVRRTYFQGYNVPSTFENPDYSLMPPMEDFRRTLYWNPDVRTDENGEAIIEFYNNSSCREIHISAEGIPPDGRCIFNK